MNKRIEKKHLRKTVLLEQAIRKECEEMRSVGQDSNEKLTAIAARAEMQEEILDLFYKEFKEMKARISEKRHIRTYIRIREELKKELRPWEHAELNISSPIAALELLQYDIEEILKDMGVEIVPVKEGDKYDENIHKATRREAVTDPAEHGKILYVSNDTYFWEGKPIVLAEVVVGVLEEGEGDSE